MDEEKALANQPPVENKIENKADDVAGNEEKPPLGFLELVYGVLFEPVPTFSRVVQRLPLGQAFLIFTLVNVAVAIMNGLLAARFLHPHPAGQAALVMKALAPVLAVSGLVFQYGKWFFYSAFLHLLAEFFGGRGRARGVWTVAGLASLPAVFLVPLNLLLLLSGLKGPVMSLLVYLLNFLVLVWGAALLVLGIRQEHGLSTSRAVAVVLLPVGAVFAGGALLVVALTAAAASLLPFLHILKQTP